MNLLKDKFISTTSGKVSLKTILTSDDDYQLQYYFDEIQLAMLQLLSSLATAVLAPTISELKSYLKNGVSAQQYDEALNNINSEWFEGDCFMQSTPLTGAKWFSAEINKAISGIESSKTKDASGLFSDLDGFKEVCPCCMPALNYNYQTNVHAKAMGIGGSTGIKGGGTLTFMMAGQTLKETLLMNVMSSDYFTNISSLDDDACDDYMWNIPLVGDKVTDSKGDVTEIYSARKIGLMRGLFALAYHFKFQIQEKKIYCDSCGHESQLAVSTFSHCKYKGRYGSESKGRELKAGWWPNPYTAIVQLEDGSVAMRAKGLHWHSWEDLSALVVQSEVDKSSIIPAPIISQYRNEVISKNSFNFLIGGNVLKPNNEASVVGRIYDLYSMPSSLKKNLGKITQVIDAGLEQKKRLSHAFNKMFGVGYDKNFIGGIKGEAMSRFSSNAQQIIQRTLLDVERKEAAELRKNAVVELQQEAKRIFIGVQRKYQHDLPLFKALVKGEVALTRK